MRRIFGGRPAYGTRLLNRSGNTRCQQAEHGLRVLCGFAAKAGQITPIVLRNQSFGVQAMYGRDDIGLCRLVHFEALLPSSQIEAD